MSSHTTLSHIYTGVHLHTGEETGTADGQVISTNRGKKTRRKESIQGEGRTSPVLLCIAAE